METTACGEEMKKDIVPFFSLLSHGPHSSYFLSLFFLTPPPSSSHHTLIVYYSLPLYSCFLLFTAVLVFFLYLKYHPS